MLEDEFVTRLTKLRYGKGVSARDMSLSIGQNENYINNIENRKALPSMMGFFYICEYFGITPQEFFDLGNDNPAQIHALTEKLRQLDQVQLDSLEVIIDGLLKNKNPRG